jgi:hypothetical protein
MSKNGKELYNPKSVAPSVFIPSWLIQVSTRKISNNAKMLYGRLSQWSNEKGHVHRSSSQLSKELGATVRNIERHLKELRDLNLIGTYQAEAGGVNHFEFYKHPWMNEPITKELCFNTPTPPTNLTVPPDKFDGTPPSNVADLKYKEIKTNKKENKLTPFIETWNNIAKDNPVLKDISHKRKKDYQQAEKAIKDLLSYWPELGIRSDLPMTPELFGNILHDVTQANWWFITKPDSIRTITMVLRQHNFEEALGILKLNTLRKKG